MTVESVCDRNAGEPTHARRSQVAVEDMPLRVGKKRVAIAVPTYARGTLSEDEEISLRHLDRYLGEYDRYLVRPRSIPISRADYRPMVYDDCFFGSQRAHTQLLLSDAFWRGFADYEFVLIYHLDALVFSDELQAWCARGYDYIGAPFLKDKLRPELGYLGVGNGGFSLRRPESMIRVMQSTRWGMSPRQYWDKYFAHRSLATRLWNLPRWLLKHFYAFNNVQREMDGYRASNNMGDDRFFSTRSLHYVPGFKLAPPEVAIRFAFEQAPRYFYEQLGRQLPFGCHAWGRYDRAFWEPFLLR